MNPYPVTRRTFLKNASAVASLPLIPSAYAAYSRGVLAFIGTYTSAPTEPYGAATGNGEGIYRAWLDPHSGELKNVELAAKTPNPSWLAIHPSHHFLYAINEVSDFGGHSGSVTAFALDPSTGSLTQLNVVSSQGAGPAHMSLDKSGHFAFVANYIGGTIAVLPIEPDGRLGEATDIHHDTGHVGARHATDAPHGSFAISGHDAPHAHMIASDPTNRFVLSTDLGQDRIYIYRFNSQTGKLTPSDATPYISVPSGDGPRHFAFHPNGKWLYALFEEASVLSFYHYDESRGALDHVQSISSLPAGFTGTNFGSEILISSNGRFLYAANRLHDSVAACSIGEDGRLTLMHNTHTGGDYPRNIALAPDGEYLFSCNQRSDNIATFHRDRSSGALTSTGRLTAVGSPAMITFVA